MKKLDFNEMEMVNGGILCAEIPKVIDYLNDIGSPQAMIVTALFYDGEIQCIGL